MRNGVVLIDKPAGTSSARIVAQVKRKLGATKVGHAGTLDPDATGLLVVLVNGATKIASFASGGTKVYSGIIRLGVRTSTDDMSGEILQETDMVPQWSEIEPVLSEFVGEIHQVPPKVSAVKVNGTRAYARHRKGESFDLTSRAVTIERLECLPVDDRASFSYRVSCSPGTYVRSLARDIGERLGCGGAVESIHREASGGFSIDNAVSVDDVDWESLVDWACALPNSKHIELDELELERLLQGKEAALEQAWQCAAKQYALSVGEYVVFSDPLTSESLGILEVIEGERFTFFKNVGR